MEIHKRNEDIIEKLTMQQKKMKIWSKSMKLGRKTIGQHKDIENV